MQATKVGLQGLGFNQGFRQFSVPESLYSTHIEQDELKGGFRASLSGQGSDDPRTGNTRFFRNLNFIKPYSPVLKNPKALILRV